MTDTITRRLVISDQLSFRQVLAPILLDDRMGVATLARRELPGVSEWVTDHWTLIDEPPIGPKRRPHASYAVLTANTLGGRDRVIERIAPHSGQTVVAICILPGNRALDAYLWQFDRFYEFEQLSFCGPGMLRLPDPSDSIRLLQSPERIERHATTRGALGQTYDRLANLRVVFAGMGRGNSEVARLAVANGVRDIVILDHDRLELRNLDCMSFANPDQLGQEKAILIANFLHKNQPDLIARSAIVSLTSSEGMRTLGQMRADAVICWVDNLAARLAVSRLCHQHGLFPHLDIGTSIELDVSRQARNMVADVRLFAGRGQGCVRCCPAPDPGSLEAALDEISRPESALRRGRQTQWHETRAGSLCHLNTLAASVAIELFIGFLEGTVTGSTWVRIHWPGGGLPQFDRGLLSADPNCPICRQHE